MQVLDLEAKVKAFEAADAATQQTDKGQQLTAELAAEAQRAAAAEEEAGRLREAVAKAAAERHEAVEKIRGEVSRLGLVTTLQLHCIALSCGLRWFYDSQVDTRLQDAVEQAIKVQMQHLKTEYAAEVLALTHKLSAAQTAVVQADASRAALEEELRAAKLSVDDAKRALQEKLEQAKLERTSKSADAPAHEAEAVGSVVPAHMLESLRAEYAANIERLRTEIAAEQKAKWTDEISKMNERLEEVENELWTAQEELDKKAQRIQALERSKLQSSSDHLTSEGSERESEQGFVDLATNASEKSELVHVAQVRAVVAAPTSGKSSSIATSMLPSVIDTATAAATSQDDAWGADGWGDEEEW